MEWRESGGRLNFYCSDSDPHREQANRKGEGRGPRIPGSFFHIPLRDGHSRRAVDGKSSLQGEGREDFHQSAEKLLRRAKVQMQSSNIPMGNARERSVEVVLAVSGPPAVASVESVVSLEAGRSRPVHLKDLRPQTAMSRGGKKKLRNVPVRGILPQGTGGERHSHGCSTATTAAATGAAAGGATRSPVSRARWSPGTVPGPRSADTGSRARASHLGSPGSKVSCGDAQQG